MTYELKFNGQNFTIPNESIVAFALMRQLDKNVTHGRIHDIKTAIESLIKQGFEVQELNENNISDIPKVPNWYNVEHRNLYNKLFYHEIGRELTNEEKEFCKKMYHMEECACGLDG